MLNPWAPFPEAEFPKRVLLSDELPIENPELSLPLEVLPSTKFPDDPFSPMPWNPNVPVAVLFLNVLLLDPSKRKMP